MKNIFLSVILVIITTAAHAQYEASLSASGGYTEDGWGLALGYNQIINQAKTLRMNGTIHYNDAIDTSSSVDIPYTGVNFGLGMDYKLIKTKSRRDRLALFTGGGLTIGYEELNANNTVLDDGAVIDTESKMLFGAFVGAELNYILSNYIYAILVIKEFYEPNSTLGDFRPYFGAGVRVRLFEN